MMYDAGKQMQKRLRQEYALKPAEEKVRELERLLQEDKNLSQEQQGLEEKLTDVHARIFILSGIRDGCEYSIRRNGYDIKIMEKINREGKISYGELYRFLKAKAKRYTSGTHLAVQLFLLKEYGYVEFEEEEVGPIKDKTAIKLTEKGKTFGEDILSLAKRNV